MYILHKLKCFFTHPIANDWDYQNELKKRQMDEVSAREHSNAISDMQANQAALEKEANKGNIKSTNPWICTFNITFICFFLQCSLISLHVTNSVGMLSGTDFIHLTFFQFILVIPIICYGVSKKTF